MSTDALRTMREEMAYRVEIWNRPNMEMVDRWLATLDAYLAVKRCPECGALESPCTGTNWRGGDPYVYAMCGSLHCERCTEGADEDAAVAAFYEVKP